VFICLIHLVAVWTVLFLGQQKDIDMADHSKPIITSTYTNFVNELSARFNDLALGLDSVNTTPTNLPTNSIRWNSTLNKWQRWNGTTWGDLTSSYAININGTVGATTPATGAFTTLSTSNGATFNGQIISNSTTDSTSTLTGAIQTDGGLGVVKALWVGGLANIAGAVTLQSTLAVAGDVAVNGGDLTTTSTSAGIFNTNATTISLGAVATALTLGATTGTMTLRNPTIQTSVTTGVLTLFSGLTTGTLDVGSTSAGKVSIKFNTTSSSSSTGALTVAGGIGVGGISYFGNDVYLSGTGAIAVPAGTAVQRPTGAAGKIRFNTDIAKYEGHNGTNWTSIGGGATGGGSDEIFIQNGQTVTTNYTVPADKNAMSTGPIAVNSGVTVTISSGARWVIL
jgi:hypothetical protein